MLCNDCIEGISPLDSEEITIRKNPIFFYVIEELQGSGTHSAISICNVKF